MWRKKEKEMTLGWLRTVAEKAEQRSPEGTRGLSRDTATSIKELFHFHSFKD